MSKKENLLKWLKREPITPAQALAHLGCFRLAARIGELKNEGHDIKSEIVEVVGGKHVARYSLVRKAGSRGCRR